MAEYINKAELKQAVRDEWQDFKTRVEVNYIVNCMPTIDIVTCKDCKHSNVDKMGWYCNKHYHRYADENTHFCSDGEREEKR